MGSGVSPNLNNVSNFTLTNVNYLKKFFPQSEFFYIFSVLYDYHWVVILSFFFGLVLTCIIVVNTILLSSRAKSYRKFRSASDLYVKNTKDFFKNSTVLVN